MCQRLKTSRCKWRISTYKQAVIFTAVWNIIALLSNLSAIAKYLLSGNGHSFWKTRWDVKYFPCLLPSTQTLSCFKKSSPESILAYLSGLMLYGLLLFFSSNHRNHPRQWKSQSNCEVFPIWVWNSTNGNAVTDFRVSLKTLCVCFHRNINTTSGSDVCVADWSLSIFSQF